MNGKTAKKLRKVAASMATEVYSTKYLGNSKRFVLVAAPEATTPEDTLANPPQVVTIPGTLMVNPNSARSIYQRLKKAAKAK